MRDSGIHSQDPPGEQVMKKIKGVPLRFPAAGGNGAIAAEKPAAASHALVGVSLHFSCAYADVSIAHRPNGGASSDQAYVAARGRVHDTPWWYSQIVNKEDCD